MIILNAQLLKKENKTRQKTNREAPTVEVMQVTITIMQVTKTLGLSFLLSLNVGQILKSSTKNNSMKWYYLSVTLHPLSSQLAQGLGPSLPAVCTKNLH